MQCFPVFDTVFNDVVVGMFGDRPVNHRTLNMEAGRKLNKHTRTGNFWVVNNAVMGSGSV